VAVAHLHLPDRVNLAEDRIECPVCRGAGKVDIAAEPCENCDGKGTLIRPTGRQHLSHSSLGMQLACQRRYQHAYVDRLSVDVAIVESAAAAYLSRYYFEDFQVLVDESVPPGKMRAVSSMAEVEYLVRLRSPYTGAYSNTFDLHGRADGVTDHGAFLELAEDKLVGQIDAVSVKKTRGDRQLSLGAYALWRITGKPVRRVRKRFTKKPQIRQRKGESVTEFCERIRADYRERPDFYMHEETTFRDAEDMLDVERSLWDWAEQRRAAARRGFWPMNTDRCHDWGGCDFLDKCFGGLDAEGLYRRKPERVTT
jgi:hypothetical protein